MKRKSWLYAGMIFLTLALIYWVGQQKEFPYSGTWVNNNERIGTNTFTTTLSIDREDGCKLSVSDGKEKVLFRCMYNMKGGSAILTCQRTLKKPHKTDGLRWSW